MDHIVDLDRSVGTMPNSSWDIDELLDIYRFYD
jgi:hypothetical protein